MAVLHDIRYALRVLRKAPGVTAVAVLSLAIGIAVNTTVFSWIRSVVLNPLPGVAESHRMVTLETVAPSGTMIDSSYPDYQAIRDRATLLSGVVAFKERPLGLGEPSDATRVWALMVSGNYFDVLGLTPAAGRFFEGDERSDIFDRHPVAVLGHTMWRTRFNADPRIVGSVVTLNRRSYTIIGIAPPGFSGTINGLTFDLYVPLTMQASLTGGSQWLQTRTARPLYLLARLKTGVTIEQARQEVRAIAASLAAEFPATNDRISATLLPMGQARRGAQLELGPLLRILAVIAALVLLIICANVANLQFARGLARQKEIGIRLGLGATRARVLRQLMTEGLVLGGIGGVFGVLLSAWVVDALRLFLPVVELPIALGTAIRGRDLLFAATTSLTACVLFALVPAFRASGPRVSESLQATGRQMGSDPHTGRIGTWLVAGQMALAMAALVSAGLLVRSFHNARAVHPGFDASGVVLSEVNLSVGGYDRDRALIFVDRLLAEASQLPGVTAVSIAEDVPLGFGGGSWEDLQVEGYSPRLGENMKIYRNLVAPRYFEVMRIPLVAGRDFTDRDTIEALPVAIVNDTFARQYFGDRSAVGRRLRSWGRWFEIVGVVATTKYHELSETPQPYFYVPVRQMLRANTGLGLHVRTSGDAAALVPAMAQLMRRLDPQLPPALITTLAHYSSAAYFPQRVAATLVSVLGVLALTLSAVGLYSLMAYGVTRRRQEIGVRMALGATSGDVVRMILSRAFTLVGAGLAAGLVLAGAGAQALGALLFGVTPLDPSVLAASAAVLALVSLVACYVPARVAARVDPVSALRAE